MLLAVLVSVASTVTASVGGTLPGAVTHGFGVALLAGAGLVAVAAVLGLGLPQRARPAPQVVGQ